MGNQVLNRDTSLPVACIRASLVQDTVRHLLNCSRSVDSSYRTEALNKFASKLVNSGHSCQSARIMIVQGVTRYLHKVKLSQLPIEDLSYAPLYFDKKFKEQERQSDKYLAKMNWYRSGKKNKPEKGRSESESWRTRLKGVWRGSTSAQKRVKMMDYRTVLQVPNSKNGVLLKNLIKAEDNLALISGYNVKMVEQSGVQLSRIFPGMPSSTKKCHWTDCPVCSESNVKGASGCRISNIVYEGECIDCLEDVENGIKTASDVGKYIGESGRTLAERSLEHVRGAKSFDKDNFIIKHWVLHHSDSTERPRIRFKVRKAFKDPMSRLIAESVLIDKESNLNSKSEWRSTKMSRLVIETPKWLERKTQVKKKELSVDDDLSEMIDNLKKKTESVNVKQSESYAGVDLNVIGPCEDERTTVDPPVDVEVGLHTVGILPKKKSKSIKRPYGEEEKNPGRLLLSWNVNKKRRLESNISYVDVGLASNISYVDVGKNTLGGRPRSDIAERKKEPCRRDKDTGKERKKSNKRTTRKGKVVSDGKKFINTSNQRLIKDWLVFGKENDSAREEDGERGCREDKDSSGGGDKVTSLTSSVEHDCDCVVSSEETEITMSKTK